MTPRITYEPKASVARMLMNTMRTSMAIIAPTITAAPTNPKVSQTMAKMKSV